LDLKDRQIERGSKQEAGENCIIMNIIKFPSLNITHIIDLRRMRYTGHAVRIGAMRNVYKTLVGNPERKNAWKI
jgi:hypothetical protein